MKKTALPPRAELNLHTAASLYDGVISPEDVIGAASGEEYSAVAVTDLNSAQFFPNVYYAAKEKGVAHKIIYGAEVKCLNEEKELLLTLLVKNQAGCKNLYRIISQWNPLLDFVKAHREGLLIGFTSNNPAEVTVPEICDYIELRPTADEQGIGQKLLTAEKLNIPAVAVSGARYLEQADAICRDVLTVCTEREGDDPKHELYLRSGSEMLEQLAFLGEDKAYELVIENPNKIAGQIEQIVPVREGRHQFHLPNAEEELQELTYKFAREKYGEPLHMAVQERLDKELSFILSHNNASHYLLYHKIVAYIKKEDPHAYIRGGGTIGAALTAHLLEISEANPLPPHYLCPHCKHLDLVTDDSVFSGFDLPDKNCPKCGKKMSADGQDIPWEMIMTTDGWNEPDICLSTTCEASEKAEEYLLSLFGADHIVHIGAPHACHWALSPRELVTRFLEKHDIEMSLTEQLHIMKKIQVEEIFHRDEKYIIPEGEEIYDFFPIHGRTYGKSNIVQFDIKYTRGVLCKVELNVLTLSDKHELMEGYTGTNFKDIPLNEPEIYELFNGEEMPEAPINATLGIIEDYWNTKELCTIKPKRFSQLARALGIKHVSYGTRINGNFLLKSGLYKLEEIIAFSEDVFKKLVNCGMDSEKAFCIMEKVSRGQLEHDEAAQEEMRKYGVTEPYIEYCKGTSHLPCKAEVTESTMYALRIAWYKLHYPAAFYAAALNVEEDRFDLTILAQDKEKALDELEALGLMHDPYQVSGRMRLCQECLMRGVRFLMPDPEKSDKELLTPEGGDIRLPLEKWEQVK